jgi:hypothetical protein
MRGKGEKGKRGKGEKGKRGKREKGKRETGKRDHYRAVSLTCL